MRAVSRAGDSNTCRLGVALGRHQRYYKTLDID